MAHIMAVTEAEYMILKNTPRLELFCGNLVEKMTAL